jgi:uncharacterized protein
MKYLPRCEPIVSFGDGGFRFAGMSHRGSLLILPGSMRAWAPSVPLVPDDFALAVEERQRFDVLIIGTGATMQHLALPVAHYLSAQDVHFDCMGTSSAIHIYNIMLGERRRVAAALCAVGGHA